MRADQTEAPPGNGDRLESWKEIAAYLRRDVRTVQRWEKTDGMPIHRHDRAHRPIPYAFKRELDAWWANHPMAALPSAPEPKRREVIGVSAIALVLCVGVLGLSRLAPRLSTLVTRSSPSPVATTQSVTALKLYSDADALMHDDRQREAETLLREAIRDDPQFASAYVLLAWAVRNQHGSPADYLGFAEHAHSLADSATEGERLFIEGSLSEFHGNHRKSCDIFAALATVRPDHYWAINNVSECAIEEGNWPRAAEFLARRADLRPDDIDENVSAAWANEYLIRNPSRAAPYLVRAAQLQANGVFSGAQWSDAWLRLRPAYNSWLEGDVDRALAQVTALVSISDRLTPEARDSLHVFAGCMMLTLGRPRDAERLFNELSQEEDRVIYSAVVAYARGDNERARRLYLKATKWAGLHGPGARSAIISARLGLANVARQFIAETANSPGRAAVEGQLAVESGAVSEGIERLKAALGGIPTGETFLAAETLANALGQQGADSLATEMLEQVVADGSHSYEPFACGPIAGYYWLRLRLLQANVYARQGRREEASRIAGEVVRRFAHADNDFPLLVDARRLEVEETSALR